MLKIKSGVDLRELEKFGFTDLYPTGKADCFGNVFCEKSNKFYIKYTSGEGNYSGVVIYKDFNDKRRKYKSRTISIHTLNRKNFDILYDLIKADMVEKV